MSSFFFFFNDTATTEIYTLSLHDALPIYAQLRQRAATDIGDDVAEIVDLLVDAVDLREDVLRLGGDRKSTRLNSSHTVISYAVFCLKKKKRKNVSLQTIINSTHSM